MYTNRKLLSSYAKKHALAISLGTVLSFMAIKVAMCGCWLGRRYWRDRQRQMLDEGPQGPTDWEIDMTDIKIVKRADGSDWELGTGNFGKVMRGVRNDVQPVAIKTMFRRDLAMEEAFIREIAMMKYISRDRNIVQFYGACIQTNNLLLVAELMEGGDLRMSLNTDKDGTFLWYNKGKSVAVDIARGLAFLHANKVIHRDMKSKNVLMTRDGTAKIGDVGMAKIMTDGSLTRDGALGTMAWAAPELLLGEKCTEKVDIYSLGVVLWEIVTQEIPQRGTLRDPVVPRDCPQEVADLIIACMQRNQNARPSAKEVCRLLYQSAPAWEEPDDVREMLDSDTMATISEQDDMTDTIMSITLDDSAETLTANPGKTPMEASEEKPQLKHMVLDIKAKLLASRSSNASAPSSNSTFSPISRPTTGPFARQPSHPVPDELDSTATYGTADLHNSDSRI